MNLQNLVSQDQVSLKREFLIALGVFLVSSVVIALNPPLGVDWKITFYSISKIPFNPYSNQTFINPPWVALFLLPFRFFSESTGLIINSSLNFLAIWLLLRKTKANLLAIILTLSSYPFIFSVHISNIEWVPAIGFLFPNAFGILLIMIKPQSGILVGIDWFFKQKRKILFILIPTLWVTASLLIWRGWPIKMLTNISTHLNQNVNYSLFPWTIPIGLGLIIYMIKSKPPDGELWGTLATLCLMPYFAPQTLAIPFTLLAAKYPYPAIIAWVFLWIYPLLAYSIY